MKTRYRNIWEYIWDLIRNMATVLGILSATLYVIYITFIPVCSFFSTSSYCDTGDGFGWNIINLFPALIICLGMFWLLMGKGNKKIILWSALRTIVYAILIFTLVPLLVNNDLIPYSRYGITQNPPLEAARDWAIFGYTILFMIIAGLDLLISIFVTFYKSIKVIKQQ